MFKPTPKIALFCDEAGKESDRYLAVGGITISSDHIKVVREKFSQLASDHKISKEIKWNKIQKGNKDKCLEFIHSFFEFIEQDIIKFHCLIVDFQRFDHSLREDGGKNQSLKRMYYQLILHRLGKKHGKEASLYAYPDKANELKGLEDLKSALNHVLKSKYSCPDSPIKAIEFRDSAREPILQMNDLVLGAICYQKNRRFDQEDAGQPKSNLAGYVLGKMGMKNYDSDTPFSVTKLTIWNLRSGFLKGP